MIWLVLLCSRTRHALAFHSPHLDELRPFGSLCFTVCDHIIIFIIFNNKLYRSLEDKESARTLGVLTWLGRHNTLIIRRAAIVFFFRVIFTRQ